MDQLAEEISKQLHQAADPQKATTMQAYLKTKQAFFGVQTKERQRIVKEALEHHPPQNYDAYEKTIKRLWVAAHREEMHAAMDVMEFSKDYNSNAVVPLLEEMMITSDNWDLIDRLAGRIFRELLKLDRNLEQKIVEWRAHPNMWLRRAALISQLCHHQATNRELLAETVLMLAPEKDFFIRKAIGWALRDYSKSNPIWVHDFITKNEIILSSLSKREGLKNIRD